LLETVRQYAHERLAQSSVMARCRTQHLTYYMALAREAEPHFRDSLQGIWLQRLNSEHENLRAAMSCALDADDRQAALRLATCLWLFWYHAGFLREGQDVLETALNRASRPPACLQARALLALGTLAIPRAELQTSAELLEAALAQYQAISDDDGSADCLNNLAVVARHRGDLAAAQVYLEECLALVREHANRRALATTLQGLGEIALARGDHRRAFAFHAESLALHRELGNPGASAWSLYFMALTAHEMGDHATSSIQLAESLTLAGEAADRLLIPCLALDLSARVAMALGNVHSAGQLIGAAEGLGESLGAFGTPRVRADRERCATGLVARLGRRVLNAARRQGQAMSLEQAVECAFSGIATHPVSLQPVDRLTPRELDVLRLVSRGRTNREIANELVIALSTAERHVANILSKLDLHARGQVAIWAMERFGFPEHASAFDDAATRDGESVIGYRSEQSL
jgi:ATP/maltotriose-dependent transcriptional regulator MalT